MLMVSVDSGFLETPQGPQALPPQTVPTVLPALILRPIAVCTLTGSAAARVQRRKTQDPALLIHSFYFLNSFTYAQPENTEGEKKSRKQRILGF